MLVEDTLHPTATTDMLAQLEDPETRLAGNIKKMERLQLDGYLEVEKPEEQGPRRIPWGPEWAAVMRAAKTLQRRAKNQKMGLLPSHWVKVKLAKKTRRRIANDSRRRNR